MNFALLHLPVTVIAAWATALVIPYLSALLTPYKGWWTGAATLVISFLSGLFTAISQSTTPLHWKSVFGVALGSWFVASFSHSKWLSGTPIETILHASGIRSPRTSSTQPPPTTTGTTP